MYQFGYKLGDDFTYSNWHSLVLLDYALEVSWSIHTSASLSPTILVIRVELALIDI